jgi:plastocyanin
VHLAGNGEATFTAPTQPGEYAFYCTYHPSMKGTCTYHPAMKGTLIVQ